MIRSFSRSICCQPFSCPQRLSTPSLSTSSLSTSSRKSPADIFDRRTKQRQRDLAGSRNDCETYSYLKEEFGHRLSDRVFDVKRTFPVVVDMGCGQGHVSKHFSDDMVQTLFLCDSSRHNLVRTLGKNTSKEDSSHRICSLFSTGKSRSTRRKCQCHKNSH